MALVNTVEFRRVRRVAESAYYLHDVCQSVRLSACISAASTRHISVKFNTADFDENLSIKSRSGYNRTKILGILREDSSTFLCCRLQKFAKKNIVSYYW
jgi:hypothetical protein